MSSSTVSKKLKFKGDKPKKKKRSHREVGDGGGTDEFEALASADPSGKSYKESSTLSKLKSQVGYSRMISWRSQDLVSSYYLQNRYRA
jgi:hypothetical protein